ncbi:hypothetical protein, partial [Salinimicrobium oceani]
TREGTECLDCPAEEEDPWGDSSDDWDTENTWDSGKDRQETTKEASEPEATQQETEPDTIPEV